MKTDKNKDKDKDKEAVFKGGSKGKDGERKGAYPMLSERQTPRFEKVMRRMDSDGDGEYCTGPLYFKSWTSF